MTVWNKVENDDCYAVAICNYSGGDGGVGEGPPHLSLEVGSLVCIERRTRDLAWGWGHCVRQAPRCSGLFPLNHVVVRDCHVLRSGDSVLATAGGGGVVRDIALVLREWIQHWKQLYLSNDPRFNFMEMSMKSLLLLRGQCASSAVPQDQLRKLTRTATRTIDKGNRTLGMELAVRAADGSLVDPRTVSAYMLDKLHQDTNKRIDNNMEAIPAGEGSGVGAVGAVGTAGGAASGVHVAVSVHNVVCRVGGRAELLLVLYDQQQRLTEPALLLWGPPHRAAYRHPEHVLFTDLPTSVKTEKIYLVCFVVRVGPMESQSSDTKRSSLSAQSQAWEGRGAGAGPGGGPALGEGGGEARRAGGVALADVTSCLKDRADPDAHIQLPFTPCEKENLDSLLKKLLGNREPKDAKQPQGLWVSVRLVDGGGMDAGRCAVARSLSLPEVAVPGEARNELHVTLCHATYSRPSHPHPNIQLTAALVTPSGDLIPGAISVGAGVPNVDQYVSLVYYHDDKPRWNETFKVCLGIEEFKEAHLVILARHRSSNEAKDRSEKPFAFSYVRLMQRDGTTLSTDYHTLNVYKIEYKKSSTSWSSTVRSVSASCLALPERRSEVPLGCERGLTRDALALLYRDSLQIHARLVSTKLTQRVEILGVLKWQTCLAEGSLRNALMELRKVPSEELVKFLQDILDALAHILTQVEEPTETYSESSYGVLVLEGLVRIVSLVMDHKYQHFQPLLHHYIDHSFCDALAYQRLLPVLTWTVLSCESSESAMKRLLQCMKCLECLMRLVVRSRELRATLANDTPAEMTFNFLFEGLMESLTWLMRRGPAALTCQGSALRYLPHAVTHLVRVYPATKLCGQVVTWLSALPLNVLGKQRVQSLVELTRGPLCESGPRATLLPYVADTVLAILQDDQERVVRVRVGKAARLLGTDCSELSAYDTRQERQLVELCIEALGELVSLVSQCPPLPGGEAGEGGEPGGGGGGEEELARRTLPAVLRAAAGMMREHQHQPTGAAPDPLLRRCICVLLDMINSMSLTQYRVVSRSLSGATDVPGVDAGGGIRGEGDGGVSLVWEALSLLRALLQRGVFPPHWADMLHLQYNICMHALWLVSDTLLERVDQLAEWEGEGGSTLSLWREWFSACSELATSAPLQLESLGAARRQRAEALYGELRVRAADHMHHMWHRLGSYKRLLIPWIVGPFLEVSFIRCAGVRDVIIPLFYDMCRVLYQHRDTDDPGGDSWIRPLEEAVVEKLDALVSAGGGDAGWRARFVQTCGGLLAGDEGGLLVGEGEGLRGGAAALVAAAAKQIDTLLQYREVNSTQPQYQMYLTMRVLQFYREIQRTSLYVRYIHKLASLHHAAGQWTEVALCLRLHDALLTWTDDVLHDHLRLPSLSVAYNPQLADALTTHRQLKECLIEQTVQYLQAGQQWEAAVSSVQQLVSQYEESLSYSHLSQLHALLAGLYAELRGARRHVPRYYRVRYCGRGFPEHLTTHHGFVYRSRELEQLSDITDRLLGEWPRATLLTKLDNPHPSVVASDGQFVQINAIKPVTEPPSGPGAATSSRHCDRELEYSMHNNVDTFIFSRPFQRYEEGSDRKEGGQNEFTSLWLERTEIQISENLPGILCCFPVVHSRTWNVSPLEGAVESMQESNRVLRGLLHDVRDNTLPLHALTMRLTGILDSAVQGGIVHYEEGFLCDKYRTAHPEHAALLDLLATTIAEQIPLLDLGLQLQASRAGPELDKLQRHLADCYNKLRDHVYHNYGRKSVDSELEREILVEVRGTPRGSSLTDHGALSHGAFSHGSLSQGMFGSHGAASGDGNRTSDLPSDSSSKSKFFGTAVLNPLARYSSVGYFGTLQNTSKQRNKRHGRKSELSNCTLTSSSQWYTTHNGGSPASPSLPSLASPCPLSPLSPLSTLSTPSNPMRDGAALRELRQDLVWARPPRASVEAERRASLRASQLISHSASHSNRDSIGTTDSNQDEEEPPPLPVKSLPPSALPPPHDHDNNNNNSEQHLRQNYDTVSVLAPRGSFLYNSISNSVRRPRPQATVSLEPAASRSASRSPASSPAPSPRQATPTLPPKKSQQRNKL